MIHEKEDIYYLSFEELHEVVRTNKLDYQIISTRKDQYKFYEKLTPPRVITSDGEIMPMPFIRWCHLIGELTITGNTLLKQVKTTWKR